MVVIVSKYLLVFNLPDIVIVHVVLYVVIVSEHLLPF